jgi:hypothetical protein
MSDALGQLIEKEVQREETILKSSGGVSCIGHVLTRSVMPSANEQTSQSVRLGAVRSCLLLVLVAVLRT